MSFKTTILPSKHTFPIDKDETILEAALEHGFTLPYSCRDGACGACKGKVLQGSVDHGKAQAFALSEEEKAAGMALFCCAKPLSDLVVESHEVTSIAGDHGENTALSRGKNGAAGRRCDGALSQAAHQRASAIPFRPIYRHSAKRRQAAQLFACQCTAQRRSA